MTDTVTRLLDYAEGYARAYSYGTSSDRHAARKTLEAELTRSFAPLSEADVWHEGSQSYYRAKLICKISAEEANR